MSKKDDQKEAVIDQIAPAFFNIENALIKSLLYKQADLPSELVEVCEEKQTVFDSIDGVRTALNRIIKERVIYAIHDKIDCHYFTNHLVINYPMQLIYLLDNDKAESEYIIMHGNESDGKAVYLMIYFRDWDAYWGGEYGDEIPIDPGDLPF